MELVFEKLLFIFIGLFSLKILWNLALPYYMEIKFILTKAESVTSPDSAIIMEWFFLMAAVLLPFGIEKDYWLYQPKTIFGLGVAIIFISYVHFFVVGFISNLIINRIAAFKKRKLKDPDSFQPPS